MNPKQTASQLAERVALKIHIPRCALEPHNSEICKRWIDKHKQLILTDLNLESLIADRERLDWVDKNKVAMNRLQNRYAKLEYWHIYWTPDELCGCIHSGCQEQDYMNLRTAIDTAMSTTEKGKEL